MISLATRKRLYREGKRLLGPDRMTRLHERGMQAARGARGARTRALRARERVLPAPPLRIERVLPVDAGTWLLVGTLGPALGASDASAVPGTSGTSARAETCSGATARLQLHGHASRRHRDAAGLRGAFVALCELPDDIDPPIRVHVALPGGRTCTVPCPPPHPVDDALARVVALLGPLGECTSGARALLDAVLGPAIERAWATRSDGPSTSGFRMTGRDAEGPSSRLVRHNPDRAVARPRTTIIVPIYGRYDFIAHQLVHFVQDDEIRASELLYVIDDPRLHAAVRADAARLARLHDIAFGVLHLPENLGYAGANNAAATVASGDELLLLNSDVLPDGPGWLGRMRAAAGAGDGCVVGARLLYDDESVQHDGMRFEAAANFDGLWLNRHPGKGLPRDLFDEIAGLSPREAVTGACLLVSRDRYLGLGGLDEGYVLGDFEDSDFCLKARASGMTIGIATDAVLYHLERQSQSLVTGARWKTDLTHYNCWVHTRRWHASITALKLTGAGAADGATE